MKNGKRMTSAEKFKLLFFIFSLAFLLSFLFKIIYENQNEYFVKACENKTGNVTVKVCFWCYFYECGCYNQTVDCSKIIYKT